MNNKQDLNMLITHSKPKSPVAEAYRLVRTNLTFASVDGAFHTLVVTSAAPGEGKSTTTANLATAVAQAGNKVLLLDCDLRKPIQHKIFELNGRLGLTNYLVGNLSLEQAIQDTRVPGLQVMTSGPIPPNPSELLGSQRLRQLLELAKERYDLILADAPPAVAVSDAAVLASVVDGVILVIRAGETKIEMVQEAKALLERAKARVVGTVLNAVKRRGGSYYYYYYYGNKQEA